MRKHARIHTKERPHTCDFEGCDKSYTDKSALTKHKRVHTGERPYVCGINNCNRAFTLAAHLTRHKLIHTGEKPHTCAMCSKTFTRSDELKTHLRVHTGERPYTCDVKDCVRMFTQASALARHKRTQHGLMVLERSNESVILESPTMNHNPA
eukprot:c7809_g1_i1.p3 GENE.c7809_g1_i1~~c7809_g1_i1.p3  ORF type:complete len:152 (-),score=26.42 c7809_g1_i1:81-536(-)